MKITIDNEDYNLDVDRLLSKGYLKPVKKTEEKHTYSLRFDTYGEQYLVKEDLSLTPTTANKLSEAISALVEYVQLVDEDEGDAKWSPLEHKIDAARESFQESEE